MPRPATWPLSITPPEFTDGNSASSRPKAERTPDGGVGVGVGVDVRVGVGVGVSVGVGVGVDVRVGVGVGVGVGGDPQPVGLTSGSIVIFNVPLVGN